VPGILPKKVPGKARNSRQSSKRDKIAYFVTIKNIVTKLLIVMYSMAAHLKHGLAGTLYRAAMQIKLPSMAGKYSSKI